MMSEVLAMVFRLLSERHPEVREERFGLLVRLSRRHDVDVHAPDLVHLVVDDLGEDQLLAQAERVVAAAVEALGGTPLKSRTRGSATLTRRSRNSYMRAPPSVTLAPTGTPP